MMHSHVTESPRYLSQPVALPPAPDAHAGARALCAAPGLAQCLWQAFAEMNDLERRIWIACMWRGEPLAAVAQRLGMTPADVRAQLRATAQAMDSRLALADDGLAGCFPDQEAAAQRPLFGAAVERQLRRLGYRRTQAGNQMRKRSGLAA